MQAESTFLLCWSCGHLVGATLQTNVATTYAKFRAMWWELQCKLRLVTDMLDLGPLGRNYKHSEGGHCLCGVCGPLIESPA